MKKYMTVFLVLMVALMLGSSAFAQEYYTLPEIREQAAQGWHETYKDKYERETVVDIEIEVFGEDKAPVLIAGFPECAEFHNWVDPPIANLMIEARQKRGGQTVYITAAEHGTKIELDKKYGEDYGSNLTPQDVYDYFRYILEQAGRSADHFLYDDAFRTDGYFAGEQRFCAGLLHAAGDPQAGRAGVARNVHGQVRAGNRSGYCDRRVWRGYSSRAEGWLSGT